MAGCIRWRLVALLLIGMSATAVAQGDVLGPASLSDFDFFGDTLAVNGERAVVSAPFGEGLTDNTGVLYVFRHAGGDWVEEARLVPSDGPLNALVGISVALGDHVLVAGSREDYNGMEHVGSAYVFRRVGTTWSEEAKLLAPIALPFGEFGESLTLTDGDEEFIVGMPGPESTSGAAFVFRHAAGSWRLAQTLFPYGSSQQALFGKAVAASGPLLAVGAHGETGPGGLFAAGAVYLYRRDAAGSWVVADKLRAPRAMAWDGFGYSLALDDSWLAAGIPFDDDGGNSTGSVGVFQHRGGAWSFEHLITAPDAQFDDAFGRSLHMLGDMLVVGAVNPEQPGLPLHTGSAYVFERDGGSWAFRAKLLPNDLPTDTDFGLAVGVNRRSVLVGAPRDSSNGTLVGRVYTFDVP